MTPAPPAASAAVELLSQSYRRGGGGQEGAASPARCWERLKDQGSNPPPSPCGALGLREASRPGAVELRQGSRPSPAALTHGTGLRLDASRARGWGREVMSPPLPGHEAPLPRPEE